MLYSYDYGRQTLDSNSVSSKSRFYDSSHDLFNSETYLAMSKGRKFFIELFVRTTDDIAVFTGYGL